MRRRMAESEAKMEFSPRVRITLFKNLMSVEDALALPVEQITFQTMRSHGVSAASIRVAGISPFQLKEFGCKSAFELREIGFDALDLNSPSFCMSAVSAFGAEEVRRAFLLSAGDAVCLSGSTAQHLCDISSKSLLSACAGCPVHAQGVIQQLLPRGGAMFGCDSSVLLDAGLRARQLVDLGYHANALREQVGATEEDLSKLGF